MTDPEDANDTWERLQALGDSTPETNPFASPLAGDQQPSKSQNPPGERQYFVSAPVRASAVPSAPSAGPDVRPTKAVRAQQPPSPPRAVDAAQPPARTRGHRRWYRPKLRWLVLYLPLALLSTLIAVGVWGWSQFNAIDRIDLAGAAAAPNEKFTNYLIVGSDSRDGVDPTADDASAIGNAEGQRSDTIILLRVGDGTSKMMSIPRDLYLTNAKTGKLGRVNGAYESGAANLVRTVSTSLNLEIHHYVEVDFVSFESIVDALGGVTIDFENPVYDKNSGLKIDSAGPHKLDGTQALAYVRSRHYTETINGKLKTDPRADIGRQERQQKFISAVVDEIGSIRNPLTLANVASGASAGLKIDQDLGFLDALSLARTFGTADPESLVLPTTPIRRGGQDVLELRKSEADPILAQFR